MVNSYVKCDLCGHDDRKIFPSNISIKPVVAICKFCGHIYTATPSSKEELDLYDKSTFASDPGANKFTSSASFKIDQSDFAESYKTLDKDVFPTVFDYISPENKKWLELRFRTGAIIEILNKKGAEAWGIDIFKNNLLSAQNKFKSNNLFHSNVHNIFSPLEEDTLFDVISCLSIHLISHLPSPRNFFRESSRYLKDNGYLVIGEKDIREITSRSSPHPLAYPNPIAHYHHMTLETTEAYIKKAGYKIIYSGFIPRKSALKHFVIIAQKVSGLNPIEINYPIININELYEKMLNLL